MDTTISRNTEIHKTVTDFIYSHLSESEYCLSKAKSQRSILLFNDEDKELEINHHNIDSHMELYQIIIPVVYIYSTGKQKIDTCYIVCYMTKPHLKSAGIGTYSSDNERYRRLNGGLEIEQMLLEICKSTDFSSLLSNIKRLEKIESILML